MIQSMLLEATVSQLLQKTRDELVKNTWQIAEYYQHSGDKPEKFCFKITRFLGSQMWFQTWLETDEDRTPQMLRSHTIREVNSRLISERIQDCNDYDIEKLFNFTIQKAKSQKQVVKIQAEDKPARIKRRCKTTVEADNAKRCQKHLVEAITDSEKRQAKLERQLFNDPQMWKFKL